MLEEQQSQLFKMMAAELDMKAKIKRKKKEIEDLEKNLEIQSKSVEEYKTKFNL